MLRPPLVQRRARVRARSADGTRSGAEVRRFIALVEETLARALAGTPQAAGPPLREAAHAVCTMFRAALSHAGSPEVVRIVRDIPAQV